MGKNKHMKKIMIGSVLIVAIVVSIIAVVYLYQQNRFSVFTNAQVGVAVGEGWYGSRHSASGDSHLTINVTSISGTVIHFDFSDTSGYPMSTSVDVSNPVSTGTNPNQWIVRAGLHQGDMVVQDGIYWNVSSITSMPIGTSGITLQVAMVNDTNTFNTYRTYYFDTATGILVQYKDSYDTRYTVTEVNFTPVPEFSTPALLIGLSAMTTLMVVIIRKKKMMQI